MKYLTIVSRSLVLIGLVFLFACKDTDPIDTKGQINISVSKLLFEAYSSSQIVTYTVSNVTEINCTSLVNWCSATAKDGELTVSVTSNPNQAKRATILTIEGNNNTRKTITIEQGARTVDLDGVANDTKVVIKGGTASSHNGSSTIEKSFDGDYSTLYHSSYSNSAANYFPITLTYDFENAAKIDYLIYYPRESGSNGLFKKFDLYVATAAEPTLKKYGEYDFEGSSSASRLNFYPALVQPIKIQFVVKSGSGDGNGFVTCAEMEFYKSNTDSFDYLSIFTDHSCSELKSDVTLDKIEKIDNKFYKELASEIYRGDYNMEFRVQSYKAWQNPSVMANINKTSELSLRDNPTGIYAKPGEEIIVFAGDLHNQRISLFIQDPDNKLSGTSFALGIGANKIKATHGGLIYVMYHTNTATEPPVKINIVTGSINGYFDKTKHKKEDWSRLIKSASFKHFDLVGELAHLTFETEAFQKYTPDGLELIDKYDDLVRMEQDFMGLYKYNKKFNNRAYFLVVYGEAYMFASNNYMGYNANTQAAILNITKFTSDPWGPAHELGHSLQTRPGLKWAGMAEVTNNIHSLYVQTTWGNRSRLEADDRYNKGFSSLLVPKIAHNEETDEFRRLIPFWQLKLYCQDVMGKDDFYKEVYEEVRINSNPSTQGACQLEFVKIACDKAQLDLTDFFKAWGFLKPIDREINDYGVSRFTITQSDIDNCLSSIASKKYAKPTHVIQYITDSTVPFYTDNKSVVKGTATYSNKECKLTGWSNVAVYEVYEKEALIAVTTKATIPLPGLKADYKVYAVAANGTKTEVIF